MKKLILFLFIFTYINIFSQDEEINKYLIPKEKIGLNNSNLRIDGFYYSKHKHLIYTNDTIRYISPLFLFKNGTSAYSDYLGNGSAIINKKVLGKRCKINMPNKKEFSEVISFFKCFAPSIKYKKSFSNFYIKDSTIKIQTIFKNVFLEDRGKILNDTSFIIKKRIDYYNKSIKDVNIIYHFEKSTKPKQPKPKYKTFNNKTFSLKKSYYANEDLKIISKEEYEKNVLKKDFFKLDYLLDTITLTVKVYRQKSGRLLKKTYDSIKKELSKISNKQIDTNQTIVINYFPAPDKCQGKEKWNSFFLNKVNRYVKKIEKKKNVQQFFIFKDKKSIKNFDKKFICFLDENQLIEKTFFKFHYPCFSYVIIRPNGNYFSQRGEYNISLIPDKL